MKNVLAIITQKLPASLTKTVQLFENSKARAVITTKQVHPDAMIIEGVAFVKKAHFKDLGPAMAAVKNAGIKVKDIATAAGCSSSTVYKAIRGIKRK